MNQSTVTSALENSEDRGRSFGLMFEKDFILNASRINPQRRIKNGGRAGDNGQIQSQ